ncbi:MAG: 6-phosphogluconolactonase [Pseudoxanthomonas sp.]
MSAASAHIELHALADGDALAVALAQRVADDLRAALAARGRASLALSGGSTPKRFLQALSRQALAWPKVAVTLVDERWVGEDSDRSNAALLRSHLLRNEAATADFVPLYRAAADVEQALAEVEAALSPLLPLDVAVLGMGADGHTASFFPGGDRLAEALDPDATAIVLPMRAPGAGEPRITLTLPVLRAARRLYLHIEGAQKRAVLERALDGDDLPMAAVLQQAADAFPVYWCP